MKEILLKICRVLILLGLVATVIFYISSFISHCADNDTSDTYYPFASDHPLRVAPDMGTDFLDQTIIDNLVNRIQSGPYPTGYPYHEHGFDNVNLIVFREHNSNNHSMQVRVFYDGYISDFSWPSDYETSSNFATFSSLNRYSLILEYDYVNDTITYVSSSTGSVTLAFYAIGNTNCYIENLTPGALVSVYALIPQKNIINYPIYLRDGELSYSGSVRFASNYSAGGDSSVTDEINDNIDGSEDLPQIDDNVPSDATDNAILRKILSAIKTFLKNVQGIGVTIINKLSELKDNIADALDSIKQLLTPATDDELKNAWVSGFSNWALYPAIMDIKGFGNTLSGVFDVNAVDTLVFVIPMPAFSIPSPSVGGSASSVKLFGDNITLDFGWYAQTLYFGKSPRDIVTGLVIPWILINFAVGLYFKFPTIIGGGSSYVGKIQDQIDIAHGVPGRYGGFLSHTTIERM